MHATAATAALQFQPELATKSCAARESNDTLAVLNKSMKHEHTPSGMQTC